MAEDLAFYSDIGFLIFNQRQKINKGIKSFPDAYVVYWKYEKG